MYFVYELSTVNIFFTVLRSKIQQNDYLNSIFFKNQDDHKYNQTSLLKKSRYSLIKKLSIFFKIYPNDLKRITKIVS